jgi:S1-C subfamily serine protease
MTVRRVAIATSLIATAVSFFTLGVLQARRSDLESRASYDAKLDAIRAEVGTARRVDPVVAGTAGHISREKDETGDVGTMAGRAKMVAQIKQELQNEMGLLPVQLLRERRSSFVELYAYDSLGKTNYGTAGYLGHGYFVTVKHAVIALNDESDRTITTRKIVTIKIMYKGKEIPAKLVDTGDANVEVHSGDWAIIKTRDLDLPALRVDTAFSFEFADPIFRLGNDYSKGIILSTGYVGQHTSNGLVTCLTDGHPGVSGGGVLDQRGNLVGIPIGRMQGDYRFSFILPIRAEMMRKVPSVELSEPRPLAAHPLAADAQ